MNTKGACERMKRISLKKLQKGFAVLCVLALVLSTLPLYAIAFHNHPYYDDYGFSASVHQAWRESGSVKALAQAAFASARNTRMTWQGTYTGTILSNFQPGVFSESLYWLGTFILLTALIAGFAFFFETLLRRFGMEKWARMSLNCMAITLMIQLMPDVGEAFYWFNGGVGNVFIYSLLALSAALVMRLLAAKGSAVGLTIALAVLAVLLGGGSYGGGLFALCLCAVLLVWLFWKKHEKRWHMSALTLLFLCCFVYSMAAPGNAVRASVIKYETSAVKTVILSLYHGVGQLGSYITLPVVAVTLVMIPALYSAAKRSDWQFDHPWLAAALGVCLYCTQFAPPLYSIASIGAGRIVNTYYLSFIVLWFVYVYYLLGFIARRVTAELPELDARRFAALVLVSLCVLGTGCLAFKRSGDVLYGVQNLSGPSAALSILTGEAAQYDHEMTQREVLLNDDSQPVVTLKPLTAVPAVFMDDLIQPDAVYDVRPSLCLYYGKQAILIEGEVEVP